MTLSIKKILNDLPCYNDSYRILYKRIIHEHQKTFLKYKNIFKGRNIAVVGCGPTLKLFNKIKGLQYIGVNEAFLYEKIDFSYMFCTDYSGLIPLLNEYKIDTCQKFYGIPIQEYYLGIPSKELDKAKALRFFVDSLKNNQEEPLIYDISRNIISNNKSCIFTAMNFALWTSPQKIYLIGCDCSDGSVFNHEQNTKYSSLISTWQLIKKFATLYYPQTEIISVNPRGLKGIFTDLYQLPLAVKALDYEGCGKWKEAINCVKECLCLEPENLNVRLFFASILRKKNDLKNAQTVIEEAISKKRDWADGYAELSYIALASGNYTKAINLARKAVDLHPQSSDLRIHLALLLHNKKEYKGEYLKVISDAPSPAFLSYLALKIERLAVPFMYYGNPKSALPYLYEAIQLDRGNLIYKRIAAEQLRRIGNFNAAEKIIQKNLSDVVEESYDGWRSLFRIYLTQNRFNEALGCISKAISLVPSSRTYRACLSELLIYLGYYNDSIRILKEVISIYPDWTEGYYRISCAYEACGKIDKAIFYADKMMETFIPQMVDWSKGAYLRHIIILLQKKGDLQGSKNKTYEAMMHYRDAGEWWRYLSLQYEKEQYNTKLTYRNNNIDHSSKENLYNYLSSIFCLITQKKSYEAEKLAKNLLINQPDWGLAWLQLSRIYKCKKEMSLAQSAAYKAFERDPHNGIIEQNLKDLLLPSLNIIKSLYDSREFEKAIVEASKLIDNAPKFGEGYRLLALCYEALGKKEKAIEIEQTSIESALNDIRWNRVHLTALLLGQKRVCEAEREARNLLAASPEWGVSWRQLSYVYKAQQDFAQAFNAALKAFELDPNNKSIQDNLKALKDAYS